MLLQGNMIYLAVVCVCNFQILFDSNLFNWITLFGVIISIGSYFICVLIESQFEIFGVYHQYLEMNTLQIQWLLAIICTFSLYPINKLIYEWDRLSREE